MAEEMELPSELLLELFRLSLHDNYVRQIVTTKIQTNWLQSEEERDFLTELKYQSETQSNKPTFGTMMLAARTARNKKLYDYILIIKETQLGDINTIVKSIEDFIRRAMFIQIYDESGELFNKNQKKKAFDVFTKGAENLTKFSLTNDSFESVFGNFPKRNANRIIEASKGLIKIPFGIDELDYNTNGGAELGELVLFLAEAKGGKSKALVHCGINAARRGIPCAHFQIEGTKRQCMASYDSAWSGMLYNDIKAGVVSEQKFKSYRKIIDNLGKGEIYVFAPERFGSISMIEIRQMFIDLIKNHPEIKLLILDYVDLVDPESGKIYGSNDERFRQQKTIRMCKEMAMEFGIVVISATQASNISSELLEDPDFVIRREFLAEDKGKVRPVDMLISINATRDERKQGVCRLFTDAMRQHSGGDVIRIGTNYKMSRFYDRKKTLEMGFWNNE